MKTRKRIKTRKTKRRKSSWVTNQNKFKKKSLKTKCGKRGGKYPTKKTCPKECDFIDMGSGGTYCNPKKKKQKGGSLMAISAEIGDKKTELEKVKKTLIKAIKGADCGGNFGTCAKNSNIKKQQLIDNIPESYDTPPSTAWNPISYANNNLVDAKFANNKNFITAANTYVEALNSVISAQKKYTNRIKELKEEEEFGDYKEAVKRFKRYKAPK